MTQPVVSSSKSINVERVLEPRNMRPTLIIALGGSGKRVIMRLRRLFFEKYGIVKLPIMDYIYFDTDTQDLSGQYEFDIIDENIKLPQSDIIDATITKEEFNKIFGNLESLYPHIADWVKKDELLVASSGGVVDGARQIRPLGRLAFFLHFDKLKDQIDSKLDVSNEQRNETVEFFRERGTIEPKIAVEKEIIVIGSLAGGTCSGAFIDTGFLCKDLDNNISSTALLFLPPVFKDIKGKGFDYSKAQANGYGALKELNYYLSPYLDKKNESYELEFEWERGDVRKVPGPAYDVAYLLENKNRGGWFTDNIDDVFQMASEFLFLDFNESSFSNRKRSLHSNTNPQLGTVSTVSFEDSNYKEAFPNRYSTFGLSQIRMSLDKIGNAAQFKYMKDLLKLMISENEVKKGFIDEEREWSKYYLTPVEIIRYFSMKNSEVSFSENDRHILENGTGDSRFKGINEIRENIISKRESQNVENLDTEINSAIIEINKIISYLTKRLNKNLGEGDFDGEATVTIKSNRDQFEKMIKRICTEHTYNSLLANINRYGLGHARYFIDRLLNKILALKKEFEKYSSYGEEKPDEINAEDIGIIDMGKEKRKIGHLKNCVDEAKSLPPFPPQFKKIALREYSKRYNNSVTSYNRKVVSENFKALEKLLLDKENELLKFIENTYKKNIAHYVIHVLKRLEEYFSNIKNELQTFEEVVNESIERAKERYEAFNKPDKGTRNLDLNMNWEEGDYEKNILIFKNSTNYRELLELKLREFFKHENTRLSEGKYFEDLVKLSQSKHEKWKQLEVWLYGFVAEDLKHFSPSGDGRYFDNAADLFNNNYENVSDRESVIKERIKTCEPRIQFNPSLGLVKDKIQISLFGVKSGHTNLTKMVNDNTGDQFQIDDFTDDALIFYREVVGFPAFAIGGLEDMKSEYEMLIRNNPDNKYLRHFEKNIDKYHDLFYPDSETARKRIQALEPFILGLLVNKIIFNSDPDKLKFYVLTEDSLGFTKKVPLLSDLGQSAYELADSKNEKLFDNVFTEVNLEDGITWLNTDLKDGSISMDKLIQIDKLVSYLVSLIPKKDEQDKTNILYDVLESLLFNVRKKEWELLGVENIEQKLNSGRPLSKLAEDDSIIEEWKNVFESTYLDEISKEIEYQDLLFTGKIRVLKD